MLSVGGAVAAAQALTVGTTLSVGTTLAVAGAVAAAEALTVGTTLSVGGALNAGAFSTDALTVPQTATVGQTLSVAISVTTHAVTTDSLMVASNVTVGETLSLGGGLIADGTSAFQSTVTFAGQTHVQKMDVHDVLNVAGEAAFNVYSASTFGADAQFNNSLATAAAMTVGTTLSVGGALNA